MTYRFIYGCHGHFSNSLQTGALWDKRGERCICAKLYFFLLPSYLALRAKCRVRHAWLIKCLLCRLESLNAHYHENLLILGMLLANVVAAKPESQIHADFSNIYYCWFSHDVIKVQTKELFLPGALFTNFPFERVLRSVIGYASVSKVATMRAVM